MGVFASVAAAVLVVLAVGGASDVVTDGWEEQQARGWAVIVALGAPAALVFARFARWRGALAGLAAAGLGVLAITGSIKLEDDDKPSRPNTRGGCYFAGNDDYLADACAGD